MLLRTLLLFLCLSSGLCATLGLFHMQAKDEDTPDQDAAAVLDNLVEAVDGNIQDAEATADDISNDPPLHEEEGLPEKIMANNIQQEVDKEAKENTRVADGAEEGVTSSDNKTEDVPIIEAPTNDQSSQDVPILETKVAEATINDQLPQDVPILETKGAEATINEATINDQPPQDVPDTIVLEALIQDQPPLEEDNEIKPIHTEEVPKKPEESRWSFSSIRSSFQNMNGYFDSLVELVGGRNGVCEYRCRYGELPAPRPGYQLPEPNGCSSSLVGFQLDLGIPAMTQCCNQLDSCYDTCGTSKYDCDSSFRSCLHDICSDLKKSLGLGTQVQTCESMADGLFNTVWTLGCRPYMNSQRAACICHEEEKDEL